jgi:hypothetical protein
MKTNPKEQQSIKDQLEALAEAQRQLRLMQYRKAIQQVADEIWERATLDR